VGDSRRTKGAFVSEPLVYGARPSAFTVFGIVCGVFTGFGILTMREQPDQWWMVFLPVAAYMAAFAWLSQMRLSFHEDRLTYQTLFVKERSIRYVSIRSIARVRGSSLFASRNTILVSTVGEKPLRVNTRLFPDEAIAQLMKLKAR